MELHELTVHQAHDWLQEGRVSCQELTEALLNRIVAVDNLVKAYLTLLPEEALRQARASDIRWARWREGKGPRPGPLEGIPLAIKDILCLKGVPTTCGSRILEGFVPPYDATAIRKGREAGAVFLGKTNLDEFAMGSSTENSAFFCTRNPWDLERVPGGSSGGSAAAVAADECLAALGSDTGGSVRQPAALCGVVGVKPSYGRVSRYGLVAFASSLDQIGVLAKEVRDAALLLGAIAGHDPLDSTSVDVPVPDYGESLREDLRGIRVGVPREYFVEGLDPAVAAAVREAIAQMEALGAEVAEVSLPHTAYALPVYYLVATAEASSNLARYDGIRYGYSEAQAPDLWEGYRRTRAHGFGAEVKRRIMLGTYALSAGYYDAYYLKAQKVRTLVKADLDQVFARCDVIAGPTSPTVAFRLGERLDDPLQMYLSDIFTIPANLVGVCAISIPCGFAEGLPVGLQIMAPAFQEAVMFQVAYAYEQSTAWHTLRPNLRLARKQEL
ncbi:MAG: Asp-tRNA(Asn)/Glu-tRNA(Gln) amidotransferase subunit GatA [Anaerolineae bacterium]